ncbi:MAG: cytochrome c [Gammaproteobacteria bacterium]|nr:cytochrome c [Gammaproteobacteria bacterium]
MKKPMILTALALFSLNQTPVQAGDADAGATVFNTRGCIACHGASGKKPLVPTYPVIGGKPADFLSTELNKLRSGERQSPVMGPMAASLSDDDIANVSAYLATQ